MSTNLLPPTQKQELKNEKLRRKIVLILFLVLIDILLLVTIMFGLYSYVSKENTSLSKEITQKEKLLNESQSQEIKEAIEEANQDLYKINSVKKEQVSVVSILEKMGELIPSTAYLTVFFFQNVSPSLNNKNAPTTEKTFFGKVSLGGIAKSRDAVLFLKKSFSQDLNFQDIYFDPSSWVKAIDADFIVEFNFIPAKK